jgi:hypothetical protein
MSAKKLNATGTYATACGIFRAAPTTLECLQCNAAIEESFGNRAQLDPGSSERHANLIALHGLVVPTHDQRIGVMLDLVHPLGLRRRLGGQGGKAWLRLKPWGRMHRRPIHSKSPAVANRHNRRLVVEQPA